MSQIPDSKPGDYFVSAIKDGSSGAYALASGPYPFHAAALAKVDAAKNVCMDLDARAVWYAYGTCRMDVGSGKIGMLQKWGYDLELNKPEKAAA